MRRLLYPFKLAFGIGLLVLISPLLFYLFCCFILILLLIVPVVLVLPQGTMRDGTTKVKALLECAGMLGQVVIGLAACRAVMVLAFGRLPGALLYVDGLLPGEMARGIAAMPSLLALLDRPLMEAARFAGDRFIPRFDLVLALAGLGATFTQGVLDGAWRILTVRQIENLPRSKARSVALGLAELAGKARPLEGADPARPILRHAQERQGSGTVTRKEIRSFYLEDETGRILVDPNGADFPLPIETRTKEARRRRVFGTRVREILLTRRVTGNPATVFEALLLPGDDVYVIGTVARRGRRAAFEQDRSEGKVIRPRGGRLGGFGFHDVFFLSDTAEIDAREYFQSGLRHAIATALWILLLCGILALLATLGLQDMAAAYGYPAMPRP